MLTARPATVVRVSKAALIIVEPSARHPEWATGAGWYVPVPWVPDYRRWWVYDGIPYHIKQGAGLFLGHITCTNNPRNHVLDGVQIPQRKGHFLGGIVPVIVVYLHGCIVPAAGERAC